MIMMMMMNWPSFRPHISLMAAHSPTACALVYLSSHGPNQVSVSEIKRLHLKPCGAGQLRVTEWKYSVVLSGLFAEHLIGCLMLQVPADWSTSHPHLIGPSDRLLFDKQKSRPNRTYRDTYVSVSAGDHMSFHFALNKFSGSNLRAGGPLNIHISSWPAGILRDFSQAFRGIFFFFLACVLGLT